MSTVLIIISVVAILVASVLIWTAAKVPKDWQGVIQKKMPYPLKTVWDYIADIEGIPVRKREIKKIVPLEKAGDSIIRWKEHTDMGGYIEFEKYEIPYTQLVKKMVKSSFGMTGIWIYDIEGDEDQCTVSITEKSTTKNVLARLMLALAGRDANLIKEMSIIEKYVTKTASQKM
jgi:hypothetical protein